MTKESNKKPDCDQCRLNTELAQSLWAISVVAKSLAEKVIARNGQNKSGGESNAK